MPNDCDLNARILAGHALGETGELSDLYNEAALKAEADGDIDRACFFYTHAYVFALDAGKYEAAAKLRSKLVFFGREL